MKTLIKAYFLAHLRDSLGTLGDIWRAKIASMITILVIGIALALPLSFLVLLTNAFKLGQSLEGEPQISMFLKSNLSEEKRLALEKTLMTNPAISKIQYIGADQALKEMNQTLNVQEALSFLGENPLPAVFVVHLKTLSPAPEALNKVLKFLRSLPEVETVQLDLDWIKRLSMGLLFAKRLITGLAILLGLAVLLVIGNTLGLHIENRKTAIEVEKLVGATDTFVRRPFLYLGFWYGFLGAVVSFLIVLGLVAWIKTSAFDLLTLYSSKLQLEVLDGTSLGLLLILGTVLGLGGAWLAVGRHLRTLQPT